MIREALVISCALSAFACGPPTSREHDDLGDAEVDAAVITPDPPDGACATCGEDGAVPLDASTTPDLALLPGDVSVLSFGALPDDGVDDRAGLRMAFGAVQNGGRVVFAAGRYDIDLVTGGQPLLLAGRTGVAIVGNGATLMLRGYDTAQGTPESQLISILSSTDVDVGGLTIDMERAPFSVGTVTAIDAGSFTLAIPAEFPVDGSERIDAMMNYDGVTGVPKGRPFDVYAPSYTLTVVGPQQLRVGYAGSKSGLIVGDRVVLRHQAYGMNAFLVQQSTRVVLHDITLYTIPGMVLYARRVTDPTVTRVRVLNKPGTARIMSSTADGLHFTQVTGRVTVSDSTIEGTGDDGVNVLAGHYLEVSAIDAGTKTVSASALIPTSHAWLKIGDTMEASSATLVARGQATILAGSTLALGAPTQTLILDALPPGLVVGDVLSNVTTTPSVRIVNVEVRRNRARGLLLHARDVVVDGCRFFDTSGPGVYVQAQLDAFVQACTANGVTVKNSTFDGCNRGAASNTGALNVRATLKDGADAPVGTHANLFFDGNIIRNTRAAAVAIASARTAAITNHAFHNVSEGVATGPGAAVVYVKSSDGVFISGNALTGTHVDGVVLDGSTNVTAQSNTGF